MLAFLLGAALKPPRPQSLYRRFVPLPLEVAGAFGLAPVVLEPVARSSARPAAVPGGLPRVPSGRGVSPCIRSTARPVTVLGGLPGAPSRGDPDVLPLVPALLDGVLWAKPWVGAMTSAVPSVMAATVSAFIGNAPLCCILRPEAAGVRTHRLGGRLRISSAVDVKYRAGGRD